MSDILALRHFSYRYPGAADPALREIELGLGSGLHLVAGDSGSGKSTLLRVGNGLVPHFHGGAVGGTATLAGHDVLSTPTRDLSRHAGFLFQDCEMQSVYATVERDAAFGLENLGVPHAEMKLRVEDALERMGIASLRSRAVSSLSGGERQRLALAGVLAMRPALIALDEPLAQLDPDGVQPLVSLLTALAREGHCVVVAEHRLAPLLGLADSLTLMAQQQADGPFVPATCAHRLTHPPDIVLLGRHLGWEPPPLDLEAARRRMQSDAAAYGERIRPWGVRRCSSSSHRLAASHASRLGAPAWALRDVTLTVERKPVLRAVDACGHEGEVTVLMGPNGGGKTTLLRCIAGILTPQSGRLWRVPGRIAYLPQNPTSLLHRSSVRAEVELTLRRTRDGEPADRILDLLGLTRLSERYPRDLSTGERQRAALAAVLAGSPRIALLDEPTRGMDEPARAALVRVLRELVARGASVVLATHDSELAAQVGDRILRVGEPSVRDLGPPQLALRGDTSYATQIGRLFRDGPVTLEEALAQL